MGIVGYDNFAPGDSGYPVIPQLVFVCEDDKHMAEVFRVIVMNSIKIDKIKFYYTTDLIQNSNTLERSLYDFVEENGKYRMRNVEAKILE